MVATFNKTIRKHIFLHPVDKKRRHAALKAALLKDKRKYSDKLDGALLDVKNLRVLGQRHLVVEGFVSMEVEADCIVFTPSPGQILEGVINKQSRSHLGCLVMGIFNASLSIPTRQEMVPQVGDTVSFVVTEVVVDGEILFMRGSLENVISQGSSGEQDLKKPPIKQELNSKPGEDDKDAMNSQAEKKAVSVQGTIVKTEPLSSDADSPTKAKKKKHKKKHIKEEV